MEELDKLMAYAISMEFNPAQGPNGVSAMGIAFGNQSYSREVYRLMKQLPDLGKLTLELFTGDVTLMLKVCYNGAELFSANLNYDKFFLNEFLRLSPPEQSIVLAFGTKRTCQFYLINPEADKDAYQPFHVETYSVISH